MTTNAIRWPRMVISRKVGVDHKCWMKLTERATTLRAKNWRRSISDIRRGDQKAAGYKMKLNKACDQTWFLLKYDKRMIEQGIVCVEKKMDAVLTYAIPYSWRLSELTPLFKVKGIILEWSNFWRIKLMSHTVKLFERIVNHTLRTIVELGNTHFVFRRGRSTMDPVVDRPLLNTKWMLPNSTIVLSMWLTICSNSVTVWDISFILQKLLHSSMIPFPLNSGASSLNLHEHGMAYDSTASIFFSRHTIPCSIILYHTSIWIRSDHMSYSTSSGTQLLSDLLYGYRRYFFSFSRVQ